MDALGVRVDFRQAKWPENLKNMRAPASYMVWRVGSSAASPDGQPAFDSCAIIHNGGQNLARFKNEEFDEIYARMSVMPDGAGTLSSCSARRSGSWSPTALQAPACTASSPTWRGPGCTASGDRPTG